MKVHHIQHVPFEGLSSIESYMSQHAHEMSATHLYKGDTLPPIDEIDWLIVMGGPMGVNDSEQYPWLIEEQRFIKEAIESGKVVLGICLGAQLIASALGAEVKKNKYREIGWFKVKRACYVSKTFLNDIWPNNVKVFHWHGDTFDLPEGAKLIASSDACANQGFILDDRVVGLQFHLEITPNLVALLVEHCSDELGDSKYVQSVGDLVSIEHDYIGNNQLLYRILDRFEEIHT